MLFGEYVDLTVVIVPYSFIEGRNIPTGLID